MPNVVVKGISHQAACFITSGVDFYPLRPILTPFLVTLAHAIWLGHE